MRVLKARKRPAKDSLEALAEHMGGAVQVSFTRGITTFANRLDYDTVRRAVISGDYQKLFQTIPWGQMAQDFAPLGRNLGGAVEAGSARAVQAGLGGRGSVKVPERVDAATQARLKLTPANPDAKSYISTRTGELIQNVTDSWQKTVQAAVGRAMRNYESPASIARTLIDKDLPLNDRQAAALDRYTAAMHEQHSARVADRLSDKYARELQQQRAMMIGRTEASFALNYGQQQTWQVAVDEGILPKDTKREWVTEANPCDICQELSGQQVGMDEPFVGKDGSQYMAPPDPHPQCLCSLAVV